MIAGLDRVEAELARIGLLLAHDRELPSVTALVAGQPIRGSWWGHPLGRRLYELFLALDESSGALSAKLVDGKLTYIHPRLWPAFHALVRAREPELARELPELAAALYRRVAEAGELRADALAGSGFAPAKAISKAGGELERRLLVHATSVHTASGAHVKVFQSWEAWAKTLGGAPAALTREAAERELGRALAELGRGSRRLPAVPLLVHAEP